MNDIHGLAQELLAIESETFEIDDFDGGDVALVIATGPGKQGPWIPSATSPYTPAALPGPSATTTRPSPSAARSATAVEKPTS